MELYPVGLTVRSSERIANKIIIRIKGNNFKYLHINRGPDGRTPPRARFTHMYDIRIQGGPVLTCASKISLIKKLR